MSSESYHPYSYTGNFEENLDQWQDRNGLDLRAEFPDEISLMEALLKVDLSTQDCDKMKHQLSHKFGQYIDALARYRKSGWEGYEVSVKVEEKDWRSLLRYMTQTEPSQWNFTDYLKSPPGRWNTQDT